MRKERKGSNRNVYRHQQNLKFAYGSAIKPAFEHLMDRDMVLAFLDKLELCVVGAKGWINKLNNIDAAL